MQERTVALVTVRSASTRLPQKFKREIYGKPMMARVVDAVRESVVDEVVVATVYADTPVIDMCYQKRFEFYAGSENDLLKRLYEAGKAYDADIVVRIWGDSPLIMPRWINFAVEAFKKNRPPYLTVLSHDGVIAVTTLAELERLNEEVTDPKDREWIHTYMSNMERSVSYTKTSKVRTVDTRDDMRWARRRFKIRAEMNGTTLWG